MVWLYSSGGSLLLAQIVSTCLRGGYRRGKGETVPCGDKTRWKGIGLLEHQVMLSLHDKAHDGWLFTFTTAVGNSISSQLESSCQDNWYSMEKACSTARPPLTKSHMPVHSPPARRAAVLGQSSSLFCLLF
jgi:hypothetical protein